MAKMRKKSELPTKVCPTCKKPFSWRKKWERDWETVIYCSKRCRASASADSASTSRRSPASSHRHTSA